MKQFLFTLCALLMVSAMSTACLANDNGPPDYSVVEADANGNFVAVQSEAFIIAPATCNVIFTQADSPPGIGDRQYFSFCPIGKATVLTAFSQDESNRRLLSSYSSYYLSKFNHIANEAQSCRSGRNVDSYSKPSVH